LDSNEKRAWKESETNHTAYVLCFGVGDEDQNGSYHIARAPAPPMLRTTGSLLIFVTSQESGNLSLSRIRLFGQEVAKDRWRVFKYQNSVPYPTFSLPLICPHDCQYLPKSLRALICSCGHTGFRACKLLFELGGSEPYLLENAIPITQRVCCPEGLGLSPVQTPPFQLPGITREYCRRSTWETTVGQTLFSLSFMPRRCDCSSWAMEKLAFGLMAGVALQQAIDFGAGGPILAKHCLASLLAFGKPG
jgi:hypothetical protein